jgi:hypothetical protein
MVPFTTYTSKLIDEPGVGVDLPGTDVGDTDGKVIGVGSGGKKMGPLGVGTGVGELVGGAVGEAIGEVVGEDIGDGVGLAGGAPISTTWSR